MLAAQLAQPPATNHTMVGWPRSEAIVAVVPDGVVKVPLAAGVPGVDVGADGDVETELARWSEATGWTLALTVPPPLPASA
jgi:hypothetical protein